MELIILYGNGIVSANNKLSSIKKGFDPLSIQTISSKNMDFEKAMIEISSLQLFSEKRLVILEDFDIAAEGKGGVDFEKLSDDPNLTVVFKYTKNLAANSVILKAAALKKAQTFQFSEKDETLIFPFLDNLAEKNKRAFLEFDKLLDEYGGQYILTMIFYLFRKLIISPKKLPDFVVKKIQKQQRNFNLEKITQLYKDALETDFKIKSGLSEEKIGLTLLVNKILS